MLTLPLLLSTPHSPWHYTRVFPYDWYSYHDANDSPKPLGLILGIVATAIGQFWTCLFFGLYKFGYFHTLDRPQSIQTKGARDYVFWEGLQSHFAQPGGFALLIGYLSTTWMMHWMPASYYSFEGTIQWKETILCLIVQDGIQYTMHYLEHVVSPTFYQLSHKPHHRFTNPRLFDAYDGSLTDTCVMIIIPLFATAHIVRNCNVWTYMAFGASYSCWLTLIHSEYVFPWDPIFRTLGLGTPADHHVHHKIFKYNYGHLFMWFDRIGGTYKHPQRLAPQLFRPRV
jgi:sterol desaturase/sphingolipid hydroxylase (fatty acid hydroxylase superfamily)